MTSPAANAAIVATALAVCDGLITSIEVEIDRTMRESHKAGVVQEDRHEMRAEVRGMRIAKDIIIAAKRKIVTT